MKRIRKLFFLIVILSLLVNHPLSVMANSNNTSNVTKEFLDDGSYFEITIESNDNQRTSIKNASKTLTYKNSNGEALWYAKVIANFYYDGTTSSCTSSSASSGTYVSGWKILSSSSSRTGNTASATVTAGIYYVGVLVDSITVKVLLSCDKNGNLS